MKITSKLLVFLALGAVAISFPARQASPTTPQFGVVSIKLADPNAGVHYVGAVDPGHFRVACMDVSMMLSYAYDFYLKMPEIHLVGLPDWAQTQVFDVDATMPPGTRRSQVPEMLKAMLADRFQMTMHVEDRPMEAMPLTVANGGPKLKRDPECENMGDSPPDLLIMNAADAQAPLACGHWKAKSESSGDSTNYVWTFHGVTMAQLATFAETENLRVADKTRLKGAYDFTLTLAMMPSGRVQKGMSADDLQALSDRVNHDRTAAYTSDLGLVLGRPEKLPVPMLVVDHIAMPSAN